MPEVKNHKTNGKKEFSTYCNETQERKINARQSVLETGAHALWKLPTYTTTK